MSTEHIFAFYMLHEWKIHTVYVKLVLTYGLTAAIWCTCVVVVVLFLP